MISHHQLDLEQVYAFNPDLLVAIISAGIYDSYFTTILDRGFSGIKELADRNPAFLYPLNWIWRLETAISWLNENRDGYKILDKLLRRQRLDTSEKDFIKKCLAIT